MQSTLSQFLRTIRTGETISLIGELAGGNVDIPSHGDQAVTAI